LNHIKLRKKARQFLLQSLYQWQISAEDPHALKMQLLEEFDPTIFDVEYFDRVLFGVIQHQAELDQLFIPLLMRPFEQVDNIELAALRLATFELVYCIDIPYRVVINEALNLTKKFGATDSYKFMNQILDQLAKQLRSTEWSAHADQTAL